MEAADSTPRVPGEPLGAAEDFGVTTRSVRAFFPVPGQPRTAVSALSAEDPDAWPYHVDVMAAIRTSVTFTPPGVAARVADALAGGPAAESAPARSGSRIADLCG
ncbi:hypothetical protein EHYA_03049 [Embleya hyalina]|uniref:Uncharacterized protein n=1 Tax=Embleya hyalina TaxID=516124 RepID=A0A401YLA4_9ACTN|nr:hypothetical protein EHYA_03049 [Embleya hyalina]